MTRWMMMLALAIAGCDGGGGTDAGSGSDAGPGATDAGPGGSTDAGEAPCDLSGWTPDSMTLEAAVIAELNTRRGTVVSCPTMGDFGPTTAVVMDPALTVAARCHALDQRTQDSPSSVGSDGSLFTDRAAAVGYTGTAIGTGSGGGRESTLSADTLVDSLLGTDFTCPIMMDTTATAVGVGVSPTAGPSGFRYYEVLIAR